MPITYHGFVRREENGHPVFDSLWGFDPAGHDRPDGAGGVGLMRLFPFAGRLTDPDPRPVDTTPIERPCTCRKCWEPLDVAEHVRRDRDAYAGGLRVLGEPAAAASPSSARSRP